MNNLVRNIRWLGYEGVLINEKPIIYINPYKLAFPDIGELILYTDNKPDHCSPNDAKWLRKGSTIIAGPTACVEKFQGDVRPLKAGDSVSLKGAEIDILPAVEGEEGMKLINDSIGFNIKFPNGLRVYQTGDTILTPEMQPGMTDVLIIPVMSETDFRIETAASIVNYINPRITIPINWDGKKESLPIIDEFKKLCNSEVEILKPKP